MKEELITFETAKLAKEKGFNYHQDLCCKDYKLNGELINTLGQPISFIEGQTIVSETFKAPTQSLLQKWLREKHLIHVEISLYFAEDWQWDIYNTDYSPLNEMTKPKSHTYEQALEKGLQEALKLLR